MNWSGCILVGFLSLIVAVSAFGAEPKISGGPFPSSFFGKCRTFYGTAHAFLRSIDTAPSVMATAGPTKPSAQFPAFVVPTMDGTGRINIVKFQQGSSIGDVFGGYDVLRSQAPNYPPELLQMLLDKGDTVSPVVHSITVHIAALNDGSLGVARVDLSYFISAPMMERSAPSIDNGQMRYRFSVNGDGKILEHAYEQVMHASKLKPGGLDQTEKTLEPHELHAAQIPRYLGSDLQAKKEDNKKRSGDVQPANSPFRLELKSLLTPGEDPSKTVANRVWDSLKRGGQAPDILIDTRQTIKDRLESGSQIKLTLDQAHSAAMKIGGKLRQYREQGYPERIRSLRIVGEDTHGPFDVTYQFHIEPKAE